MPAWSAALIGFGVVFLFLACIAWGQPRPINRVWYWNQIVPGLQETPDNFYAKVHQRLQAGIAVRHMPLKGFGFGPSHLFENRTIWGERPLYLQARYKQCTYYLYVSQTPAGLYISEWLFSVHGTLLADPWLKFLLLFHIYQ